MDKLINFRIKTLLSWVLLLSFLGVSSLALSAPGDQTTLTQLADYFVADMPDFSDEGDGAVDLLVAGVSALPLPELTTSEGWVAPEILRMTGFRTGCAPIRAPPGPGTYPPI